jgi:exosortase
MKKTWPSLAIVATALLICYASILNGMIDQWLHDDDMSQGLVVPIVILWVVWRERDRWGEVPAQPSLWGLGILLLAAAIHAVSALGGGLFAGSVAFLLSVVGLVVLFRGFALLRAWVFPLLLSFFMLPKLAIVYNQTTLPLQLLASRTAAAILTFSGVGIIRQGNILEVAGHRIEVAEACSGIRYLLPLGFIALVFGYFSDKKPWMRAALYLGAVPVAILANAVRVAAAAWQPALETGAPHAVMGACDLFSVLCDAGRLARGLQCPLPVVSPCLTADASW